MLNGLNIVLVEDDEIMGGSLLQRLKLEGASVSWHKQTRTALGAIRTPRRPVDAVICDIRLPDGTGEELFATLCQSTTPPAFLFITGHGGIEQAVRLMKAGAIDYVTKPFEMATFLERLSALLSKQAAVDLPPTLGISPAARRVDALALQAAANDRPVLIVGGAGTGKALVARRIHEVSERRAAPFVSVNLAREPDMLQALFGAGGAWERVGDGVLFLNALSRLDDVARAALMEAYGAGFKGRIIAACGQEMASIIREDGARADFFYRLNMQEVPVPPLSNRPEDAVWLMQQLFPRLNPRRQAPLEGISPLCEDAVRAHDWPGGGRELRARVQRGMDSAAGPLLQVVDIFPEKLVEPAVALSLAEARAAAEKAQIIETLGRTGGQLSKAAKQLKISRTTLWEKMQKFGITGKAD